MTDQELARLWANPDVRSRILNKLHADDETPRLRRFVALLHQHLDGLATTGPHDGRTRHDITSDVHSETVSRGRSWSVAHSTTLTDGPVTGLDGSHDEC